MISSPKKAAPHFLFIIAAILFLTSFFVGYIHLHHPKKASSIHEKALSETALELRKGCSGSKETCYVNAFNRLTIKAGPEAAIQTLLALQKIDPSTLACHPIAHAIGRAAYQLDKKNWRSNFANATTLCSYGVGHGLIESYSQTLPVGAITNPGILLDICKNQAPACPHVFGHILLIEYKGDLAATLQKCAVFHAGIMRDYCYNGVFMEEVSPVTLVEHGLRQRSYLDFVPRLPALISLCNSYSDKNISSQCWGELSQPALKKFENNPEEVFKFCDSAPIKEARTRCDDRIIASFTITNGFDLNRTREVCALHADIPGFENDCIALIVSTALGHYPPTFIDQALDFCKSEESQYKAKCFNAIKNRLHARLNPDSLNTTCKRFPPEFQNDCLTGKN